MEAKRLKLDTDKIEQLSLCPICAGIPEREIYQCSAGHVICHTCITKVTGGLCPQCRVRLWENKIRCRMMEQLLDAQRFPCKFSDDGCPQFLKREEITSHSRVCNHNPDLIPHCQQMGSIICKLKLGNTSRARVISHFSKVHKMTLRHDQNLCLEVLWRDIVDGNGLKEGERSGRISIFSKDESEMSPLFVHYFQAHKPDGYLSMFCVKVWESETLPSQKYRVEYSFNKGPSNPAQPEAGSSNSQLIAGQGEDVSPIVSWTTKVYNIKEAAQIFKDIPFMASIAFLKANLRGDNSGDYFSAQIYSVG